MKTNYAIQATDRNDKENVKRFVIAAEDLDDAQTKAQKYLKNEFGGNWNVKVSETKREITITL